MAPQAWQSDLPKPQGDKGLTLQQRLTGLCSDNQCNFKSTQWCADNPATFGKKPVTCCMTTWAQASWGFTSSSHQKLFRLHKCCGPSAKESVFGADSRYLLLGRLCPCCRCLMTFYCPWQSPVESGVASFPIKSFCRIFPEHIPRHTGYTLNACHSGLVLVPSFSQGKDKGLLIMC